MLQNTGKTEVYLPSFELKVSTRVPELENIRLSESRRIKDAKIECSVEIVHAIAQEEGLTQPKPDAEKALMINQEFMYVLTDGDLEEKVENMPLFVARVTPENFIAY